MTLLDFLRDVGKHVTVNQMMAKDSVRNRLEGETGISFTEFSYMLLQAHDYWWLHTNHDCVLQLGGSDQWGNITAGIDLIRRKEAATVHGLTVPLMTRADGAKFGKSQDGSVWLDPAKTSPYQFFQYLVQMDDRDAERFLLQLTLLPVDRCAEIVAEHQQAPERRLAQRELARALTDPGPRRGRHVAAPSRPPPCSSVDRSTASTRPASRSWPPRCRPSTSSPASWPEGVDAGRRDGPRRPGQVEGGRPPDHRAGGCVRGRRADPGRRAEAFWWRRGGGAIRSAAPR